jgi:GT2 family glycosyltransferase
MTARARVVVATYNRLPFLRLALGGYLRQTTNDFTLAVADDGSDDGSDAFVRAFAEKAAERGIAVDHVHQEDDGFRKARIVNEAVRRGGGEELLIFTDSDCVPPAGLVERHLALHVPHSFAVGGVVFLSEEVSASLTEADIDAGRHETLATPADRRDLRHRARKSRWGMFFRRKNRPKVFGANLAVDARLFEAVNGFDEGFVAYGFEDDDLRDRMLRLRPRPAVRILHGKNDVFHLWHPRVVDRREPNRAYYRTSRPIVCEAGLRGPPGR